jgi:hypothetical protein
MRIRISPSALFQSNRRRAGFTICLMLVGLGFQIAGAQQPASPAPVQPPAAQSPEKPDSTVALNPVVPQTPRQKQLAEDTARLLVLANQLKAELDKSSKDTLSLSVIKKAGEVEKLAHKVSDEMKTTLAN